MGKKDDSKGQGFEEFDVAWKEYFKDKPQPKNEKEEMKQYEDFINWYNNVRKQTDTGKTPAQMHREIYGVDGHKDTRIMDFEWDDDYEEPDDLLQNADELIKEGNYKEALEVVNTFLKIVGSDEEGLLIKVEVLNGLGRYDEAEVILSSLERKNEANAYIPFHRAQRYFHQGDMAQALRFMDKAYAMEPENFDFTAGLANYLYLHKDPSYKDYLDQIRRLDPKRAKSFEKNFWIEQKELMGGPFLVTVIDRIANLLEKDKTNEMRKNVAFLMKYEKEVPSDIIEMVCGLEIESYFADGDIPNAEKKADSLINRNKNNPHAYFYKANLFYEQEKFTEALKFIDVCLDKADKSFPIPHPDFYLLKAKILKTMDNDDYLYYETKGKELLRQAGSLREAFEDLLGSKETE